MRWRNPRRHIRVSLLCTAALCTPALGTPALGAPALAAPPPDWTRSYLTRVEALAVLQTLNADLLSHDSATLTLERWCGAHHLASAPRVIAVRVPGVDKPPTPELRRDLGVAPNEAVGYRRVRLMCGDRVLSEADNWYVPGRLTREMNSLLDTSDTPFGVAVRALHFQRHTLSSTLLWSPLSEGWDMNAAGGRGPSRDRPISGDRPMSGDGPMPSRLLEHRALLTLPDGTPFSEVVETYTDQVLDFPVPQP